ncbi:MAG: hypothetical protein KJ643_15195 [Gammaproteobacteria bacterium]|uniref:hypothetical protein n=1 Tax=Pseudomonas mandelii TaxID=75612 RepID=UPI0012B1E2A2|nr:hypothetical protein [Pseudomonas mandelii]MBU0523578.1 hypothetical protein [Gammaproteobacteria bacterium]MBU0844614.1 hypothetical protein [Gammaproteobacteria bacterium]MBU1843667.1 hypothetical protein [Gammaproteobacteria bacterium]MSU92827.1 hypothetical protein [Pseudomonas mandelii]
MSNNTLLKTATKQMISDCKAEAEAAYMNRVGGYAEDFQGQPDRHGNLPRRMFRGAQVEFTAKGVNALLDLVFEKVAQGYKRCSTDTTSYGIDHIVYLIKPEAEIQADLIVVLKEAEDELRARIEKANEAIIADTIAKRKAQVLKEREEAAKAADAALEAELDAEVRAALKGAK